MVAPDLIDPDGDAFLFAGILALDHDDGQTVDEEDHVFAIAIAPVVPIEFFGNFKVLRSGWHNR
jgi:hypothetical protein